MKRIISTLLIGGFMAATATISAQNTNSGYFLDGYTYRYQLNPAFGGDKGFVSMPALGNINVGVNGNLHLNSVIFNRDGRTVLFTNPEIAASEVLDKLHDKNRIGANLRLNVLSVGFKAWGGFNTVSINARAGVNLQVPKSFFELAKEGISNRTYNIDNLRARAIGYAEVGLNHSRDIKPVPGLRVGMSMKFLVGMASLDAYFNRADLTLNDNTWIARTDADIYANIPKFQFEQKINDNGRRYVSGANMDGDGSIKPNGFGMAFDFGATYKWRDFNFSLAVLDLGWISFKDTKHASTDGLRTVNTDAYIFSPDGDANNSFSNEWDRLREGLDDLYQLNDKGNIGSRSVSPGATLNIGVDYTLPVYRKLHFGILSSTRLQGSYTWTEMRLSANVTPVKFFSADANVAVGTYGTSFGWLMSIHPKGFNLFLGMDHTLGKLAKQGVPLSSNASVNLGINFPF